MLSEWAGHAWTIGPALWGPMRVRAAGATGERHWSTRVADPTLGSVTLTCWWQPQSEHDALVLIVHGLGGDASSPYVHDAARAARAAGFATLRINLRGADGEGGDLYHAGLHQDLAAVLADPSLRAYARVMVLGYSLGGHVSLSLATAGGISRLAAVAAVCAPLDLSRSCAVIDRPRAFAYRGWILHALKRMYASIEAAGHGRSDPGVVRRIDTLRDWDEHVVAVRHGFADADDYYARASVASRLDDLSVPALWVGCEHDPMVPPSAVRPALAAAPENLAVRWLPRGGHVGYPRDAWGGAAVESQIMRWFRDPSRAPA
jgi:predicted alpha/beta-fold hydrolase